LKVARFTGELVRNAYVAAAAALLALLFIIASSNAYTVRHDIGFDYQEHVSYARQLIYDHSIPSRGSGRNEYYTPPLFYLVFGAAIRFAYHFGATFPDKVARAMNVPLLVGTGRARVCARAAALADAPPIAPGRASDSSSSCPSR